jgi:hypothetical protein
MSATFQRFKAECPGCGKALADSSKEFLEDAANAHAEECDDLEAGEEVSIEEVEP